MDERREARSAPNYAEAASALQARQQAEVEATDTRHKDERLLLALEYRGDPRAEAFLEPHFAFDPGFMSRLQELDKLAAERY